MRTVAKRLLLASLVTGVVVAIVVAITGVDLNGERHYRISDGSVDVELQKDGSLRVTEQLTFHFTGSFQGAYRELYLNGDARITDVSVSEGDGVYDPGGNTGLGSFSPPGTFGSVQEIGLPYRIVWHYAAADEVRTFQISYRVVNAATAHRDVVDVSWTIWGDQWDFALDHLDATFSAASGAAPSQAWLRPRSLGDDPVVGEDATVSIDHLKAGQAVGMRAVFPRGAVSSVSGAELRPDKGLTQVLKDEARQDEAESTIAKLSNWAADDTVAICALIAGIAALIAAALALLCRERRTDVPEYVSEPPEQIPPALAYAYAREGDYDDRLVLATLLDLVDRGHYESRPDPGKDLDLQIKVSEKRPESDRKLRNYETAVLDFFDKLLKQDWVALGKMSDRIPKHSTAWKNRWDGMNEKLDEAESGELSWDRDLRRWRTAVAGVAAVAIIGVGYLAARRTGNVGVSAIALVGTLSFVYVLPGTWLKRLEAGPRQRNAEWRAFERWTRDFPKLDDDPPATLKLWRRILVYAVAFDTAQRVVGSGRIPAPVGEEAEMSGAWTSYAVYSGSLGHGLGDFSSGFSSRVAPESSSSSGSSGGGGGGGFSGGGGGGAW